MSEVTGQTDLLGGIHAYVGPEGGQEERLVLYWSKSGSLIAAVDIDRATRRRLAALLAPDLIALALVHGHRIGDDPGDRLPQHAWDALFEAGEIRSARDITDEYETYITAVGHDALMDALADLPKD